MKHIEDNDLSLEELKKRYEDGESMYSIAKKTNISKFIIRSRLSKLGIHIRENNNKRVYINKIDHYPEVYTDKDVNVDEDIETYFYK